MSLDITMARKLPWQARLLSANLNVLGRFNPRWAGSIAFEVFCTPRRYEITPESMRVLNRAVRFTIPYDDSFVAAYRWGRGPTVLLVHGWQSNASRFKPLIGTLVNAGFEVVAIDGPAHGASPGKRTNLIEFSGAVAATIKHLGDVHAVIAHSFGGSAAGVGLGLHPDTAVNKMVLVGAVNAMDIPIRQFGDALDLPRRVVAEIQGTIERRFGRPLDAYRLSSLLCNVETDLMIIHDRQDRIVNYTNALEIYDALPNAQFIATEGLGHRRILLDEAIVAQIVDFVAH